MALLHATTDSFDKQVLQADKPVLVDFWAAWCGPCRMIAPVVEQLAQEYDGKALVCKVDVDESPELAQKYGVMSIPTLAVFKNGQVAAKSVGALPKPRIQQLIDDAL
ncbi:MAG: thioredoxin [Eubacteriales bacterium]|nr:thioredoxin [Eubacteriales bacterium]